MEGAGGGEGGSGGGVGRREMGNGGRGRCAEMEGKD